MKKKILALSLTLALGLSLTACGGNSAPAASAPAAPAASSAASSAPAETVVLNVAASPTPHAEILEQVKPILAEQGIDLQIHEYGDYVIPNTAVEEGDEDVNYFQHQPYLDQFNAENGTHLVSVAPIHYEPFGIYPCKSASLEELPNGATVAVPNDATNEARALQLLAAQGLIEIDANAGLKATPNDITSNPRNLKFVELEAAMVPQVTTEVDIAAINGNYALQAGFSSAADAIALEDPDSEAAKTFANIIVVKEGNENNPAVLALVEALQSDTVRDYINSTYNNNVLPSF
ncbi:MetQ/NlpA family ABC transporter substrate-binding protein [Dysosmobacter sp.]|uniref:MetQ/NlpA family ABC transporter substrate-binding protein n=1 Tax=Dysosmobacter sp. TaxID=2591382 RepID=UPI002A8A9C28|nr:MetQ/NlpA family ABC transporter substrate-binding protein [Dysosmobacter sp.]MDY3281984.1 MetQ/NlpA family ABC transporter substrate-binding protein [Dysosmobacter sp.]